MPRDQWKGETVLTEITTSITKDELLELLENCTPAQAVTDVIIEFLGRNEEAIEAIAEYCREYYS